MAKKNKVIGLAHMINFTTLAEEQEITFEPLGFMAANAALRIRYLSVNDAFSESRKIWMGDTFKHFEEFEYSENGSKFISVAEDDFDVLIVGGNDVRRICKIVRANQMILNRRLKISLMSKSSASRRAQVISAGFDDAIDVSRIAPMEAIARVNAMWARYQMRADRDSHDDMLRSRLDRISEYSRLSDRERKILALFLEKGPGIISYFAMQQVASSSHETITFENLKVVICNLRKKLRDNVKIRSVHLRGYELVY